MTPAEQVKTFSEGVEFVRFGVARDEDFEIYGDMLLKGKRAGAASGTIVKPAPGYTFVPYRRGDIRTLSVVAGLPNQYMAVRLFADAAGNPVAKDRTVTIKFSLTDSFEKEAVDSAVKFLTTVPGFVSVEDSGG